MRNLAYIYTVRGEYDTALVFLGEGLKYEPENKAIYSGRAEINYALHLPNIAREDYLKLLSLGDTTVLYLKRIGVGFSYNFQFDTAKYYMEKAFRLDSSDYEICCYLGQIYQRLKDLPKSEYYYSKAIKLLSPVQEQLAITYESLGDVQNKEGDRDGALISFLETFDIMYGPGLIMKIANIYDEYLGDSENAIKYYEMFLESDIYGSNGNSEYPPAYINQVKTRYDFLKEQQ